MTRLLLPNGYRNAKLLHKKFRSMSEVQLIKNGQRRAVTLFRAMSQRVPAYKDFLKKNRLDPKSIRTIKDFVRIPPINKDNYLRKYHKKDLCWDGKFGKDSWVISTTSGSTGIPYYFPRQTSQDWQYATAAELYLRNNFEIHKRSTLYIVAFPMGAWIGGLFTYEALKTLSRNGGYDLSIITPGIHKQEVINAVKELGGNFDQIIIGAYAPFLKDILDDGKSQGINWKKYKVGFVFSAEAFTEKFRDYVFEMTQPDNPLLATLNHYGTVDVGTMAHETPESIAIRRELVKRHSLITLFPENRRQPTFAQFDPNVFYFEEEAHSLFCTAYSGLPLVRYDLQDYGGVIRRARVHKLLTEASIDPESIIKGGAISAHTWNLPFVYVYERNDFSVSYYAFNVYPDTIRRCLESKELFKCVTGKFTMLVDYNKAGRQKLLVNVEMTKGTKKTEELRNKVGSALHRILVEESSEYREILAVVGSVVKPKVLLWNYEDKEYFKPGTKQRWVIK